MGTALNNLFGKGKSTFTGDVEFWHGAERTGWLMKQGNLKWKIFPGAQSHRL